MWCHPFSAWSLPQIRCFPQSSPGKVRSSHFFVMCLWTSHPRVFYEQTQYLLLWVQVPPRSEEDRKPPPCAFHKQQAWPHSWRDPGRSRPAEVVGRWARRSPGSSPCDGKRPGLGLLSPRPLGHLHLWSRRPPGRDRPLAATRGPLLPAGACPLHRAPHPG